MRRETLDALARFFESEDNILVAYLFGSHARKTDTPGSDIDIALLLSETPDRLLNYHLYLVDKLSEILGDGLDLIILNTAPPMLKHQVIKHGKIIYSRSERARITFETRAQSEYLDFSTAMKRYDECLIKQILE
jgi:hypothetical protein